MITNFRGKKRAVSGRNIFFSVLLGILLIIVLGFLALTNIRIKQRREKLISRIENLKNEIQILEEKNKELKTKISQSETKEYLEKVAREQFGLKAPGEEVVVISKEKSEGEEGVELKKEKSLWDPRRWWEWLKNKVRD